jgi:hypothetical protein
MNQSGTATAGQRMEREYHCRIHFLSVERDKARQTARVLMETDPALRSAARRENARICLLPSTDIQCAPCNTSDKLVVRLQTVGRWSHCPAGTLSSVD